MMKKHWFVLKGWPDCTLTSYKDRFAEAPNGVSGGGWGGGGGGGVGGGGGGGRADGER
jgi:hypothetical protein